MYDHHDSSNQDTPRPLRTMSAPDIQSNVPFTLSVHTPIRSGPSFGPERRVSPPARSLPIGESGSQLPSVAEMPLKRKRRSDAVSTPSTISTHASSPGSVAFSEGLKQRLKETYKYCWICGASENLDACHVLAKGLGQSQIESLRQWGLVDINSRADKNNAMIL